MDSEKHQHTNELIHETSPYLLQHAHNPVNWYPWGEKALKKATEENKLLIISIGYAACHWCHVMEHDSFENEEVAAFMNRSFVCIKVDREERPDIDQVYISAVQAITGQGGWPLNCIALPDGRPLYGGTFFPKQQWMNVLNQLSTLYRDNPVKSVEYSDNLTRLMNTVELDEPHKSSTGYTVDDLNTLFDRWQSDLDFDLGGHSRAPKFPLPVGFIFLLHYHTLTQNPFALDAVKVTLDNMSRGGIYDQLGGGFARYSVDEFWKVPHFEKMLYDNGQLISLYSQAFQVSANPVYKRIVEETVQWVVAEMSSPEYGFYASIDADSEGVEGKFYCWTYKEFSEIFGDEVSTMADYYSVSPEGNWDEGMNILHIGSQAKTPEMHESLKLRLLDARKSRVRPALDDKILCSWNSLLTKGLIDGYRAFADENYLLLAEKNIQFILKHMLRPDGGLYRNYKSGRASINGFLDDYAFTISALIQLYQATFKDTYIHQALALMEYCIAKFYDIESGLFFYTSDEDTPLIVRKKEVTDHVIPSSNSEMALNIYQLGHYFYREDLIDLSEEMLAVMKDKILKTGVYGSNWARLLAWFTVEPYTVCICGPNAENMRRELCGMYLPQVILSGSSSESDLPILAGKYEAGKTRIYLCRNKSCSEPLDTVEQALKLLKHVV